MEPREEARIGALVLAAGGSSRMGRPKQLIERGGRTLVRNATLAAVSGGCDPVAVVVGAHAEKVRREVSDLAVSVVEHPGWRAGLGSSIARGVAELVRRPDAPDAVMLLLCDQPMLSARIVRRLARVWRHARRSAGTTMAACEYAGSLGTPAVFGRAEFARLAGLVGDRGAQPLLLEAADRVARVAWAPGAIDLDRDDDCVGSGPAL